MLGCQVAESHSKGYRHSSSAELAMWNSWVGRSDRQRCKAVSPAVQICSGGVCACKAGFTACAARGGRCLDAQSCPGGGSSSGSASDLNTQGSGGQADNDLLMG